MKSALKLTLLSLIAGSLLAQRPWQEITTPTLREVASRPSTWTSSSSPSLKPPNATCALWIQDESDYPSGFAGGNISRQVPQLGMQGIVADIRVHVVPGQTLTMPVPGDTLAVFATKTTTDQQIAGVIPIPVPDYHQTQVDRPQRRLDAQ
jgi:hypothetical protein